MPRKRGQTEHSNSTQTISLIHFHGVRVAFGVELCTAKKKNPQPQNGSGVVLYNYQEIGVNSSLTKHENT